MNLKRIIAPKEVKIALNVLDEMALEFRNSEAINLIHNIVERAYLQDFNVVLSQIGKGVPPRIQVYFSIANLAGDLLASGKYHMYRGVINPLGPGNDLLNIYYSIIDKLNKNGTISQADAEAEKSGLRKQIQESG